MAIAAALVKNHSLRNLGSRLVAVVVIVVLLMVVLGVLVVGWWQ